jgi:hypothetical protein
VRVGGPVTAAPPGKRVKLYVDLRQQVQVGDVIRTRTGRRYSVDTVRVQQRGIHTGRQHLQATVMSPDEPDDPDVRIFDIGWYSRG